MVTNIFFYFFATVLIIAAIRVITAKNPVHAVLFLILAFINASCLWLMLNVEFLALALIFIYVGAVMVLFLFIIMMLDIDVETLRQGFWKNLPLALMLGLVILIEMVMVLVSKPVVLITENSGVNPDGPNQLFWTLYTEYAFPVELASLILLLGLVVAVALALRKNGNSNAKTQNIAKQLQAKPQGRLQMIHMEASAEVPVIEEVTPNTATDLGEKK